MTEHIGADSHWAKTSPVCISCQQVNYSGKREGHIFKFALLGIKKISPRLSTFEEWPPGLSQKPQEMAEAGLIYLGQNINIFNKRGNETPKIHKMIP